MTWCAVCAGCVSSERRVRLLGDVVESRRCICDTGLDHAVAGWNRRRSIIIIGATSFVADKTTYY
jgi:hypothetical protein